MPLPISIPPTLFRELEAHLLTLLRSLSPDEWHTPTVCPEHTVKDVAALLLEGALCHLSIHRDTYHSPRSAPPAKPGARGTTLPGCNPAWTGATDHLSPRVLIDLLENTSRQYCDFLAGLNPSSPAPAPVMWAGESHSQIWFEIARVYTDRWHWQREIALALGRQTPIDEPHYYNPVLKMLLRAMAYTFKDTPAREGTTVRTIITGPAGGTWQIMRAASWSFMIPDSSRPADATATIPKDAAWLVLTKPWPPEESLRRFPEIKLEGDQRLAMRVLEMASATAA
jgi:hypothetical protein